MIVSVGMVLSAAYLVALAWAMTYRDYDVWGSMVVAPALILLTLPLAKRVARAESDPRLRVIILLALLLKLVAAIVRYAVAFRVYDGVADATGYIDYGQQLAESYRGGVVSGLDLGPGGAGTGFVRVISGLVFTIIGPTGIGAFLVFSWLGFWGLYFFYRAFRLSVPDGDHRRYALLVFFLPSLLFWPSSIGKEAWMMLTLGLSAYGVARVLAHRRGGYLLLAAGLAGAGMVRPHLSLLVAAALAVAYILRRPRTVSALGPVVKLLGLVTVGAVLALTVRQTEAFFGVQDEGATAVTDVLDETAKNTAQGGSEFDAPNARSLGEVPSAIVAVLFRPFPFEAHNIQARIASLEGVALLALFALSWPRLRSIPRHLRSHPYVAFAVVFAVLFCVAFSSIGNFGILTRQRVQLLPLAVVALAMPATASSRSSSDRVRVRN